VKLLIENGAGAEAEDSYGERVLHIAASEGFSSQLDHLGLFVGR
jgi:ankyrin repeat protein